MQAISLADLKQPKKPVDAEKDITPNLTPIRVIGNGAFGYVFEAYDNNNQCKVAVKRTQKAGNIISREYEVLNQLKGAPNVIQMLDFFYSIDSKQRLIQNTVLEFMEQSLEDVLQESIKNQFSIPMNQIKDFMYQIFNGLAFMHKAQISHRDLKPENILMKKHQNNQFEVKICDLGSSKNIDLVNHMNTPYVVSRYYRAPELVLGCFKYDFSIDIWATGCILFELITKKPMFPGDLEGKQVLEQVQLLGSPSSAEIKQLGKLVDQPVLQLLNKAGKCNKVDFVKIFSYPKRYLQEDLEFASDLLCKCLKWIPEDRITAAQALDHPFFK